MKTKINLRELKLKKLRFKRRRFRVGIILSGIFATIILAFNFWFIDHAEDALEKIVTTQSNGKLRLKVEKFRFNWIKNKIELDQALIYSTDTSVAVRYAINTQKISVKARGFLPLLFKNQILIDSIRLYSPQVIFTRVDEKIKKTTQQKDSLKAAREDFSVAEEMGRVSKSINDAISVLQVHSFKLDAGSFALIDKTKPQEKPFQVDNIFIQLDNLQFDSTKLSRKKQNKINFTDNIAIRTSGQNIIFPGNRHFLSFKDFRVNLQNKRVEFDSCTLRAIKGDSSKTTFRIFFDKLQLTNINFDTLYSSEVIIADSAFCSNPKIFLDIDADQKTSKKNKKGIQKIDDLIQQLLGDMSLNYIGVINADINVNTIRKGKESVFSSRNNNFEIFKLLVRQNQEKPVRLNKFVMTLHNFENVLGDGRYAIAFDSIGFENDIINLNKFNFKEFDKGHIVKSLSMPSFQVRGLSWESLLYDNTFNAQSAVFYRPVVDYTTHYQSRSKKSRDIFATLNNIDDIMNLRNLDIRQGDITLRFGRKASLYLQNTNLSLLAEELTSSSEIKNVQRSVKELNFDKAVFKKGDLIALLHQAHLSENKSGIRASGMNVTANNFEANAYDIKIGNVVPDRLNQSIILDGVSWGSADIVMTGTASGVKKAGIRPNIIIKNRKAPLLFKNINGSNTQINVQTGNTKISGSIDAISIQQFFKPVSGRPDITGLSLSGQGFLMQDPTQSLSIGKMDITDNQNSIISDTRYRKINAADSVIAVIPRLTIIPDITQLLSGNFNVSRLVLTNPEINARIGKKDPTSIPGEKTRSGIVLDSVVLERPHINLTLINKNNVASYVHWNGTEENSFLQLTGFTSGTENPIKADQVKVYLSNFEFINTQNKRIATDDNKLNLEFNDVVVHQDLNKKTDWKTNVNILSLDKLTFDSLGKNNAVLELDKGAIKNIVLNAASINNIGEIIAGSPNLDISGINGQFITAWNQLQWQGFAVKNGVFSADSFSMMPHQSVEDYRKAKAFNADYLKLSSGKILGGPLRLEKFDKDSILSIGFIEINDLNLFTFKDKTQPDTVKKYKPLPAELLLALKNSLDIDSIRLKNMRVTYWELNPQTDTLGVLPISNLDVQIHNIKNHDIHNNDSIYIAASGNVLNDLPTTFNLSQSYTDPLGYLVMKLSTGHTDLTKFNTVLVPLTATEVSGGHLNRLEMNTVGNNTASTGTMRMYYNGLKLKLLNKKELSTQTFMNKLASRLAMAFVIRKHNNGKESLVFFERLPEKSPINYMIKTAVEGLKSGVGLPGAKRKLKRYNESRSQPK